MDTLDKARRKRPFKLDDNPDAQAVIRQLTIRERVRSILEQHPEARNSDGYLFWLYARKYLGLNLPRLTFAQLRGLNFDSVRRARQYIQHGGQGELLPTDPTVVSQRGKKRHTMNQLYG